MSDTTYEQICRKIWSLYERTAHLPVPNGVRNVLLPPPRRKHPVTVLVVGTSPNQNATGVRFGANYDAAKEFACQFEYTEGGPTRNGYRFYYRDLLNVLRRVDERLGLWWELDAGTTREFLVEFTDALPVATCPGDDDIAQFFDLESPSSDTRQTCKQLLEMQLHYYKPKVVLANGRLPSTLLWEICADRAMPSVPPNALFPATKFGCSVHLSGFIPNGKLDAFSRARLVSEIAGH